jgi:hypothetical protein
MVLVKQGTCDLFDDLFEREGAKMLWKRWLPTTYCLEFPTAFMFSHTVVRRCVSHRCGLSASTLTLRKTYRYEPDDDDEDEEVVDVESAKLPDGVMGQTQPRNPVGMRRGELLNMFNPFNPMFATDSSDSIRTVSASNHARFQQARPSL